MIILEFTEVIVLVSHKDGRSWRAKDTVSGTTRHGLVMYRRYAPWGGGVPALRANGGGPSSSLLDQRVVFAVWVTQYCAL